MGYWNELYVKDRHNVRHHGSCKGSDVPHMFGKVKSIKNWITVIDHIDEDRSYFWHKNKEVKHHLADHVIVLVENVNKWYEFWKPKHEVYVSIKYGETKDYILDDPNQYNFVKASIWQGDQDYEQKDIKIININNTEIS